MGTWRTLHPRRILHEPGAISVHDSFRQVSLEPGPSGQELRNLLPENDLMSQSQNLFSFIKRNFGVIEFQSALFKTSFN